MINTLRDTDRNTTGVAGWKRCSYLYLGKYRSERKKSYMKIVENLMLYIFVIDVFRVTCTWIEIFRKICLELLM